MADRPIDGPPADPCVVCKEPMVTAPAEGFATGVFTFHAKTGDFLCAEPNQEKK